MSYGGGRRERGMALLAVIFVLVAFTLLAIPFALRMSDIEGRAEGDFDAEPPPDAWKLTPWLKSPRIEYAAPQTIHHTEDHR